MSIKLSLPVREYDGVMVDKTVEISDEDIVLLVDRYFEIKKEREEESKRMKELLTVE